VQHALGRVELELGEAQRGGGSRVGHSGHIAYSG
jgi:hypothetical protein